ncbi:MAG: N-acetyltransferase [Pseudomonadota bacterium]
MIRSAVADDLADIVRIAAETHMFLGDELQSFAAELQSNLHGDRGDEPHEATLRVATTNEAGDSPVVGVIYFAPEVMAQGVMNLLFIAVDPNHRKRGVGRALLAHFESSVVELGARLAIIETASDPMFAPAWSLYRRAGYEEEARIRDYYDRGLDKLIFRRAFEAA